MTLFVPLSMTRREISEHFQVWLPESPLTTSHISTHKQTSKNEKFVQFHFLEKEKNLLYFRVQKWFDLSLKGSRTSLSYHCMIKSRVVSACCVSQFRTTKTLLLISSFQLLFDHKPYAIAKSGLLLHVSNLVIEICIPLDMYWSFY